MKDILYFVIQLGETVTTDRYNQLLINLMSCGVRGRIQEKKRGR